MPTSLTVQSISARVQWDFANSMAWGDVTNSSSFAYSQRLTNGTGAGNADKIYVATGSLAGAANLDLDCAGVLTDMFGSALTFTRLKVIYVENTSATTNSGLWVGGLGTNALVQWVGAGTDKVKVRGGGVFLLASTDATGYAVVAGTADILRITNIDAGATTYKIVLVGASA